jgi:hypothetical protein
MLTALFSLLSGLVTGALPEVLKEVTASRASKREREFLQLQHQMQMEREKIGAENKMREAEASIIAAEMQATREHLTAIITEQAKPTGVKWIDGFNAMLRPTVCALVTLLFAWIVLTYVSGVMGQYNAGKLDVAQLYKAIFTNTIIGETIIAVWGFLFGYRGFRTLQRST